MTLSDENQKCRALRAHIAKLEAALAERDVCGAHCPACVEFTTMFTKPDHDYPGCLRLYSDSNMQKDHAPIGQPCPYAPAIEDSAP